MDLISHNSLSCGVGILRNIHDKHPRNSSDGVKSILEYIAPRGNFAYIIFSDANVEGNGRALADYIANIPEKYNISTVYEMGPMTNPNSGNNIRVWVWEYSRYRLIEYLQDMKKEKENES